MCAQVHMHSRAHALCPCALIAGGQCSRSHLSKAELLRGRCVFKYELVKFDFIYETLVTHGNSYATDCNHYINPIQS